MVGGESCVGLVVGGEMAELLANFAEVAFHIVVALVWWRASVDLESVMCGILVVGARGGDAPWARGQSRTWVVCEMWICENGRWLVNIWRCISNGVADHGEGRDVVDVLIM